MMAIEWFWQRFGSELARDSVVSHISHAFRRYFWLVSAKVAWYP